MPALTVEEQFAFLIACIKHAINGKPDFEKVAQECGIVSKAAAAKRYERLMKAHGIHSSVGSIGGDAAVQTPRAKKAGGDGSSPAKKRKRTAAHANNASDDLGAEVKEGCNSD